MSSPLLFVRDGRTLPFIPVTVAAMQAIAAAVPTRRLAYARSLYMALLEIANEDRADRVAVSRRTLRDRSGCSPELISDLRPLLEEAGVVVVHEQTHDRYRAENEWVVVEPEPAPVQRTPVPERHGVHAAQAQQTQEVRQEEPLPLSENGREVGPEQTSHSLLDAQLKDEGSGRARAESAEILSGEVVEMRPPLRFGGREVPGALADDALAAFAYYCERTGQNLRPTTAAGKPSEGLSLIIGAMTDYPEVRVVWRRMIDHCLMAPWWSGQPSPNVIFGKEVRQQSIQKAHRRPMPGDGMKGKAIGQQLRALSLANSAPIR